MADFRGELNDPDLIRFYDYWASLCGGRPMPSRKDIDPLQIAPEYLPNLMLIEAFHDPRRYRYRLVGTNVVGASGDDRTGRFFDEADFFKIHPVVIQQYDHVDDAGPPLYSLEPFTNLRNGSNDVDRLMLPLSSDGQRVDMLMVLFQLRQVRTRSACPSQPREDCRSARCWVRFAKSAPKKDLTPVAGLTILMGGGRLRTNQNRPPCRSPAGVRDSL